MQSISLSDNFTAQSNSLRGLHVAIIMDGNGRWAARRGLPRFAGHRAGIAAVRRTVEHAPGVGIACLTLYAFSSDNWRRPAGEVQGIFRLMRAYLRLERRKLRQQGVRLEVIGRRDRLAAPLLREIENAERFTRGGQRLCLRVAVDYSSRDSIARAAAEAYTRSVPSEEAVRRGVTDTLAGVHGDVDLLIRTGGEKRLSDFLLWESAYAELCFIDRMWPEFDAGDLDAALHEFRGRERRFGGLSQPVNSPQLPAGGVQ